MSKTVVGSFEAGTSRKTFVLPLASFLVETETRCMGGTFEGER
jgi:hypothetical protein